MNRPRANVTVRREIVCLNEQITGDGQASEGEEPTKGALKTKGTLFYIFRFWGDGSTL